MQSKRAHCLLAILLAIFVVFCISLKVEVADASLYLRNGGTGALPTAIAKLRALSGGFSPLATLFALLLSVALYKTFSRFGCPIRVIPCLLSLLFGVLTVCGRSVEALDSLAFVTYSPFQLLVSFCVMASYAFLFYIAELWLYDAFDRAKSCAPSAEQPAKQPIARFFGRHYTFCCFVLLLLCWSPFIIGFFPGCVNWDTFHQLNMFYGVSPRSNHHPYLLSCLIGAFVQFGRNVFHSDNIGIYLFFLLQSCICAFAYANLLTLLRELKLRPLYRRIAILFFALVPTFGAYAIMGHKDTLFAALSALFLVWNIRVYRSDDYRLRTALPGILYAVLMSLCRNNGIYIVLLAFLAHGALLLMGRKQRQTVRVERSATISLGIAIAILLLISNALLPYLQVAKGSKAEMLSVPFQQTARYFRKHGDEVTPAERKAINCVLDADNLAELYAPTLSDGVKGTYKGSFLSPDEEIHELKKYIVAWLRMGMKHPLTYLEATLANTSGYYTFSDQESPNSIYDNYGMVFRLRIETDAGTNTHVTNLSAPKALAGVRDTLENWAHLFMGIPILNPLYSCPFYTWLLLAITGYFLSRREWKKLLISALPPLCVLGVCLLSPVNNCFRYFLPIAAMTPALLGLCLQPEKRA